MLVDSSSLDDFIKLSDTYGGPGAPECDRYWKDFKYVFGVEVNQDLDPFSDQYFEGQLNLYREISGRQFEQTENELGDIDVEAHVMSPNPYGDLPPSNLSLHIERLARALRFANPPRGGKLLDMGCGWGLSSELAAYSGLDVLSIDVNPQFVSLVNRRAANKGHSISAREGVFDLFQSEEQFDMIQFYECFHHAAKPWKLAERMTAHLKLGGKIVLSGEPVNDIWWKNWGLRLDPLSVYCIRKFGWFESGWSKNFLTEVLQRAGLIVEVHDHPEADVGQTWIASLHGRRELSFQNVLSTWGVQGIEQDDVHLIASGDCTMNPAFEEDVNLITIQFENFRQSPLRVTWTSGNGENIRYLGEKVYAPGRHFLSLDRSFAGKELNVNIETWYPADEAGSLDARGHGIHISKIFTFRGGPR